MAYGLPSVSFDLAETRVSAGDSALFVADGDLNGFVDAIELLLDDPELRVDLGMKARHRVETILDWRPQAHRYVCAFDAVLGLVRGPAMPELAPPSPAIVGDDIDLEDANVLTEFMRTRGRLDRETPSPDPV
ncbi:Glycosyl transferase group 1 (fragment) [Nostocoides japonicum T1-X7]|uniref:Glycosyl transferase group 1 n=1 Tax=Nostocoides japonicum T1-X7 TaxID=1194083 RepID=A0A077M5C4_9MICO